MSESLETMYFLDEEFRLQMWEECPEMPSGDFGTKA